VKKIYNISAGKSFVDELAAKFFAEYRNKPEELAEVLFLLPTRRSCQNLTDAFVRQSGLEPTILPQIMPVADIEEDEIFLSGQQDILHNLDTEIDKAERVLIFTRLILQKPDEFGSEPLSLAQAYALAQNLAALLDMACYEELDFSRLSEIVPAEYAAHWQENLRLLKIIIEYWPQILKERHAVDAAQRRKQLLSAECRRWKSCNTRQRIVMAGTTAAFPMLKEMAATILGLPQGEVYLYGIDYSLDDDAWGKIDENHPQYELKELLDYLQISRSSVNNLGNKLFSERERLTSEVMRPAATSAQWRQLRGHPLPKEAFTGLKLINCDDIRQEARVIALIIRNTLETPEKTAALVTADRNLARRVVAELRKWNIVADDSAGQPLSLTPVGIYLRLILNVLTENFSQVGILSLLKHPFTSCGMSRADFKNKIRRLETEWRRTKRENEPDKENEEFLQSVYRIFLPLKELYFRPRADIGELFRLHLETAERLADTDVKSGDKIIWKNEAGQAAADLAGNFLEKCTVMGQIRPTEYAYFFDSLLAEQNVRLRYGMHPRVKILGAIEARLAQYDVTIVGEVNEGSWPKSTAADLWMSRPMKREFGFPLPERNIGVQAADFAHLLNAPNVYLVRADKVEKTPMNKSRWWLRLETVLSANFSETEQYSFLFERKYAYWAKYMERAEKVKLISAPMPCPDVSMRPRELSASNIEYLLRNPYVIFAKYILKLFPLQELDKSFSVQDYGNIVHEALQNFNERFAADYPEDAEKQLLELGYAEFEKKSLPEEVRAFWLPRFRQTVKWLTALEKGYRENVSCVYPEIKGAMVLPAPAGDFKITAKADRLDVNKDGSCTIIDYKTGRARSKKEMITVKAPQLPVEGLIAVKGGFGLKKLLPSSLRYWQLNEEEISVNGEECEKALANAEETLLKYISVFDMPNHPYYANPNLSKNAGSGDYDHLSRFLEWSVQDGEEKDGESDE